MIGKTLSHYKILEKLGEGGMGVVYKAEDIQLTRLVALKFLSKKFTTSEKLRQRFRNEARATSPLNHPNICTIHDFGETEDDQLYFVMAFCEGETIQQKIKKNELGLKKVLNYAIQTAQGISEAHSHGIIHRDIKPANLMVTKKDVVKILDFGISKVDRFEMKTKEGAVFGSLGYMSPEQSRGTKLDHRTDIWSFGVVFYEALTGRRPFEGEHEGVILNGILNEQPTAMSELVPDIPLELERIVEKAMAKKPEDRYRDIDEMLLGLQRVERQVFSPVLSRVPGFKNRKISHRQLFSAVVVTILLLLLIALWPQKNVSTPDEQPITLAVADFENHTEEKELSSLSGMLITVLEGSRRLSVLTRSRMYDLIKQMKEENVPHVNDIDRIDEGLARKICVFADIDALVIPSIRKFGNLYSIDLKVVDPVADTHLFVAEQRGENKISIPNILDLLSTETHDGLKIERSSAAMPGRPGDDGFRSTNLEAYYHFYKGMDFWYKLKEAEAEVELRKAIAIDSTFGLPYALLVTIYIGTKREELAQAPLQKAMKYLDNTPERERFLIRAIHSYFEEGPKAAVAQLRKMASYYPDDKRVYLGLGYFSVILNNHKEAEKHFNKALELDPSLELARQFFSDVAKK